MIINGSLTNTSRFSVSSQVNYIFRSVLELFYLIFFFFFQFIDREDKWASKLRSTFAKCTKEVSEKWLFVCWNTVDTFAEATWFTRNNKQIGCILHSLRHVSCGRNQWEWISILCFPVQSRWFKRVFVWADVYREEFHFPITHPWC